MLLYDNLFGDSLWLYILVEVFPSEMLLKIHTRNKYLPGISLMNLFTFVQYFGIAPRPLINFGI
jgi:hypothetical protein